MSTANDIYKKIYDAALLKKQEDEFDQIRKTAENEHKQRCEAELARLQASAAKGSKKKLGYESLSEEFVTLLVGELTQKYNLTTLKDYIKNMRQEREDALDVLAPNVEPVRITEMRILCSCHTYQFSTQTNPHFYAHGKLVPMLIQLQGRGYTAEITFVTDKESHSSGQYDLVANCEPYVYDALRRTLPMRDELKILRQRAINPLVIYPLLQIGDTAERLGVSDLIYL